MFIIFSCKKNEASRDSEKIFPSDFINPSTQINIKVDDMTHDLLERLTHYSIINQYNTNCVDVDGNVCEKNKMETIETKLYFYFDDNDKKLIVLDEYLESCNCSATGNLLKRMCSISLNEISSIDTISSDENRHGQKITALIITPKYNKETIEQKEIRGFFNKNKETTYRTYSDKTNNSIFIKINSELAMHLKDLLEKLVSKYSENYPYQNSGALSKDDNFSNFENVLQNFQLTDYYKNETENNNIGSVGCFYSKSLIENHDGFYSYVDDYENVAIVKFDNTIIEFTIISTNNSSTVNNGFLKGENENYLLILNTKPHFKNGIYEYTEANIRVENKKSKKYIEETLYGSCGC